MTQVTLGRTGLKTGKNAFGALPIQRVSRDYAALLLRPTMQASPFLTLPTATATVRRKSATP